MIEKHTLVVGPFQCNCSILVCQKTKEAIVIDAGDEFSRIQKKCEDLGVTLKASIHTHAHLDHIGAVSPLKQWSKQTVIMLHEADRLIYDNLPMQGQLFGMAYESPPAVDRFINDQERIQFGEHEFEVIHTPGHSPGGVCLRFNAGVVSEKGKTTESPTVFTGDTLFAQSIGRTDLWEGDHRQLISSIKERLLTLDEETRVHPGHGGSTTIAAEKRGNPFL